MMMMMMMMVMVPCKLLLQIRFKVTQILKITDTGQQGTTLTCMMSSCDVRLAYDVLSLQQK